MTPPDKHDLIRSIRRETGADYASISRIVGVTREHVRRVCDTDPTLRAIKRERLRPRHPDAFKSQPEKIGATMYDWRTRHGLNQTEAAAWLGVNNVQWSRWENDSSRALQTLIWRYLILLDDVMIPVDTE